MINYSVSSSILYTMTFIFVIKRSKEYIHKKNMFKEMISWERIHG